MVTMRAALDWVLPVFMAGMLAATIGLLAYLVVSAGGASDNTSYAVGVAVTLLTWAWEIRLIVRRGRRP